MIRRHYVSLFYTVIFWVVLIGMIILSFFSLAPRPDAVELTVQSELERKLTEIASNATPTPSPNIPATVNARLTATAAALNPPTPSSTPTAVPTLEPTPSSTPTAVPTLEPTMPPIERVKKAENQTTVFTWIAAVISALLNILLALLAFLWSIATLLWNFAGYFGAAAQCLCCIVLPLVAVLGRLIGWW